MKLKFFDLAKKMANKSEHPEYRIGGVIVKKSKVISLGFNRNRTHPKSNHPFKNIHCELDCILGIDPKLLSGATIYLYRESKLGIPAISKPCKWCHQLLLNCGIKEVAYTFEGNFKKEKLT